MNNSHLDKVLTEAEAKMQATTGRPKLEIGPRGQSLATVYLDDGTVEIHGEVDEAAQCLWSAIQHEGQSIYQRFAESAMHTRELADQVQALSVALKREQRRGDQLQGELNRTRQTLASHQSGLG